MKKIFSLLIACILLLSACSKKETAEYKTDVSVDEISSKMYEAINLQTLTQADAGWIALNIPVDTSLCDEHTVYISINGESNLFGVFKASSEENAEKLFEQSEEYLTAMEENWMSEYSPEELPKIQNAVRKKCGLYVTFLILDDKIRDSAEREFENLLKA